MRATTSRTFKLAIRIFSTSCFFLSWSLRLAVAQNSRSFDCGLSSFGLFDKIAPDLASANQGAANLGAADLGAADLGAANLGAADLGAANLGAADLGAANLGAANLGAADLGAADLGAAAICFCCGLYCAGFQWLLWTLGIIAVSEKLP